MAHQYNRSAIVITWHVNISLPVAPAGLELIRAAARARLTRLDLTQIDCTIAPANYLVEHRIRHTPNISPAKLVAFSAFIAERPCRLPQRLSVHTD